MGRGCWAPRGHSMVLVRRCLPVPQFHPQEQQGISGMGSIDGVRQA